MTIATDNTNNQTVTISRAEYEQFLAAKRATYTSDRRKAAGQEYYQRKDALILRRVKDKKREDDFFKEEEGTAYALIHKKMLALEKEQGTYEKGKTKIEVSDEKIAAFIDLEHEGHHFSDITLAMIEAKIAPPEDKKNETAHKDEGGHNAVDKLDAETAEDAETIEVTQAAVEDEPSGESISESGTDEGGNLDVTIAESEPTEDNTTEA